MRGATPSALLTPFTTDPLPRVTSRGESTENLIQIIDPDALQSGRRIDVVTANRSRHPLIDPSTNAPTLDEVWNLVNCPTRYHIFDVYLHRDIERSYR